MSSELPSPAAAPTGEPRTATIEARTGTSVAWTARLLGTANAMAAGGPIVVAGIGGTGENLGAPATAASAPVSGSGASLPTVEPSPRSVLGEPGAVLVALDAATGAARWRMAFAASEWATVTTIAATANGGVIAGGSFSGTLRAGEHVVSSAGKTDGFVVAIDALGKATWLLRVGGPGADAVQGVAERDGRIAVAGTFGPGAELRGTVLPAFDERLPYADGFVAEVDPAGARLWSATFGGKLDDAVAGVAIDSAGRVAVAATARDTLHVAGQDLVAQGDADGLVGWWGKDGTPLHAVLLGGADFDGLRAIAAVGDRIVVAGFFSGSMRLGAGAIAAGGGDDAFIASFDARGAVHETWQVGGPGREEVTSLAAVPGGFIAGIAHTAALTVGAGGALPAPSDPMAGAAVVVRPVR